MLYQRNTVHSNQNSENSAKQDKPANVALKLFLSFLLVFSMIPSGLSLQSFAENSNSAVENAASDQSSDKSFDDNEVPDSPDVDTSESTSSDQPTNADDSSNATETDNSDSKNSDDVLPTEDNATGLNLPVVQAVGTTIYWSPVGEDIKEGETVIVKAGNDRFDGSGRNSAVRTWSRVQELMKDEYSTVTIYLLAPITPGLVSGETTYDDSMTLNPREDGINRNVTMYTVGTGATSAINVNSGKTITLKNINIDITDTSSSMAQQSISVAAANGTDEGGHVVIGENVTISGRIIVNLDAEGGSSVTKDGSRVIKNPVQLDSIPFTQGSIDIYFKNLNIDNYLGGVSVITSDSVENLKNYFTLNAINQNEGFSFVYEGEIENPDSQSTWNTKVLRAYKKQEVATVYLDPANGSDDNTGLTHNSPVQTITKAKDLLTTAPWIESVKIRTVTICGTYSVTDTQTWDFSNLTLPSGVSAELRMCEQNGLDGGHTLFKNLIDVTGAGNLTIKGITIRINFDADKNSHNTRAIHVSNGGTLTLQAGTKITGGIGDKFDTQAPGYGVYVENSTTDQTTFNMEDGSEVSYFSRGIHLSGSATYTTFNFNGGLVTQNSNYTYRLYDETGTASNWGGGGIYANNVSVNMSGNATISNNESFTRYTTFTSFRSSRGSGILLINGSRLTMNGGSITNNKPRGVSQYSSTYSWAWCGAGIYSYNSYLDIKNANISDNSLTNSWSTSIGAGIYFYRNSSDAAGSFNISGGSYNSNVAKYASAIYAYDYGSLTSDKFQIVGTESAHVTVANNSNERSSSANSLGAVCLQSAAPRVEYVDFIENTSAGTTSSYNTYSAGLYIYKTNSTMQGSTEVKNCTFSKNTINSSGGYSVGAGLYISYGSQSGTITTIDKYFSSTIENCVFSENKVINNSTSRGGAMYLTLGDLTTVHIKNNSFTSNSASFGGAVGVSGGKSATDKWVGSAIFESDNTFNGNTATAENGGEHIYGINGTISLLGASFTSSTSSVLPAIRYSNTDADRFLLAKTSGISLTGCYGAYLDNVSSFVTSLDSDTTNLKSFPINSIYTNVALLKGASEIKISNEQQSDVVTYNIEDVSSKPYIDSTDGAISTENELIGYNKCIYVQKKADNASDGIYIDGVYGNDDNMGLSALSAVKTLAKAKERLKNKITEANANNTTFKPYIIVNGKVTLSEDADVTLTAEEIGVQSAKSYDAIPSTYVLPAEDKEFFPMYIPSETLNDAMFEVDGAGITVNFNNVYFDGRSKTVEGSRYYGLRVSNGTANINGVSRFVNFRRNVIISSGSGTSGASPVINLKDKTFIGYSGHVGGNLFSNLQVASSVCNISDDVLIERSNPRFTDSSGLIYGYGVNVIDSAIVNMKGNSTVSSSKSSQSFSGSAYYCAAMFVNNATVNVGDSDTDTQASHARITPGNNSLGFRLYGGTVNMYGHARVGNDSGRNGFGFSYVGSVSSAVSAIKLYNNSTISFLRNAIYSATYAQSFADIELNDNSKINYCNYAYLHEGPYYYSSNGITNITTNNDSSINCERGIEVNYHRSDSIYGMCANLTMSGNSSIQTTYSAYSSGTAKNPKIVIKDNSSITSTSGAAISCYGYEYGEQKIGDITIQDNAVLSSGASSYSIYVSSSTSSSFNGSSSVVIKDSASVSSVFYSPIKSDQNLSIQDFATVTKSSKLDFAVSTNKIASIDMTSSISGDIRLLNEGYVLVNDPTSLGTQGEKFSLLLNQSKRGTRVIGPGNGVSNAQDYKTSFKTQIGYDLSNGVGSNANWLVLDSDNNVYMSYSGSDTNSGRSTNSPVKTFKRAKEIMKELDSGANFLISGSMYPVKAGELEWSLDDGGTFTNNKGETWKPYIDIAGDFSPGSTWIYVTDMSSSSVMKFKNLNFTHDDETRRLSTQLIYGYSTSSNTTSRNAEGSKIELSGCLFENIKAQTYFTCLATSVASDVSDTIIRDIDFQTLNTYGLIMCWTRDDYITELNINSVEMSNNSFKCNYSNNPFSLNALINAPCRVNIANSKFNNNSVERTGAYVSNGSLMSFKTSAANVQISNSEIRGNSYSNASGSSRLTGSCIYSEGTLSMRSTTIDSNTADNVSGQGAVYLNGASNSLTNCMITNNHSGICATSNSDLDITGGDISTNGKFGGFNYNSVMEGNITLRNNALIRDVIYISNSISLGSIITNPDIHYSVYPNSGSAGRVLVKPDGQNVVSAEGYINNFEIAPVSNLRFELGRSEGNIVLVKPLYIGGSGAADSRTGLSPKASVQTFAKAQEIAKTYQAQGKYINYYICGTYSSSNTAENWNLNDSRTADGKLSSFVYRYNGQDVPGVSDGKIDAFTGNLISVGSGQAFNISNITIDGTTSEASAGTFIVNSNATGKVTIGENAILTGATSINGDANASIVDNSGVLTVNNNARLNGTNNENKPAILQHGEMNLANTPYILGSINLSGSGSGATDNKVIKVEPGTKGYNSSSFSVVVGGPYNGRVVVEYPNNYAPTTEDLATFAFDDSTAASYSIGANPTAQNQVILTTKNVVYLDNVNGDDNNNGFSPDYAKKTLSGAWAAMNSKKTTSGKGGGVIYLVSTLTISDKVEIRNVQSSGSNPEYSYLTINDGQRESTEGYVSFRRYSQPTKHASLSGYSKPTNAGKMINILNAGNLSLINSVNVDGHGNDIDGADDVAASGVSSTDNTITSYGSLNINSSNFIHMKHKASSAIIISSDGSSTIRNSSFDYSLDGDSVESHGIVYVDNGTLDVYTSTLSVNNSNSENSLVLGFSNNKSGTVTLNGLNHINGTILESTSNIKLQFANINARNQVDNEDVPFKVDVINSSKGFQVAKYVDDEAPSDPLEINERIVPVGGTYNKYNIVRNSTDDKALILDYFEPVFIGGSVTEPASDDNDGLTPATAVKTLRAAYQRAKATNAGYIVFVNDTVLSTDTFNISNMQYSDSVNTDPINLFRPVEFVRYVKPTATITGFEKDSYGGEMITVSEGATLNIGEITISGNHTARTVDIPESMKKGTYSGSGYMLGVYDDATVNLNEGAKLYDNTVLMGPECIWINGGTLNIGAATILQSNSNNESLYAIRNVSGTLRLNDPNNATIDRISLTKEQAGQTTRYNTITLPQALDTSTKIKVCADEYVRDQEIIKTTYQNPDFSALAEQIEFPSNAVPSGLSLKKKYGTTDTLALEDYQDITITKTWKKTDATKSTHPDNAQFKITSVGAADNISEVINVSVPTSGTATATHGSVTSKTVSGEDIWTITLNDMPTYINDGTSSTKITYNLEETQVGGKTPSAAKWKATVSGNTTQGTFTVSNTKQHVLSYDKNSVEAIGTTPASQTLDYGVTVKTDAATSLTRGGYSLIGWNTNADGTGTHYNPSENIFIDSDITLYAMWAKLEIEVVNSDTLDKTIARGQKATVRYTVTSTETNSVLGNFKLVVNYDENVEVVSNEATSGGLINAGNRTITWNNPQLFNQTVFNVVYKATTNISLNDKDSLPLSATATFDSSKNVNTSSTINVTDAFNVTYNANGATSGTAPVDSKYYWAKTDATKNATVLGGTALKKVTDGKTYTFVGWNENANGTGIHYNATDVVDVAAKGKDITLYAQWGEAAFDVTLEQNKAKVRRGEQITYTLKINLPEGSDTTTPLKVELPVPTNTSFVSADKGGTNTSGKISWTITNAVIGENTVTAKVKVGDGIAINDAGSIVANATVTHKTSNTISASSTIQITKSYKITYNLNGAAGTTPTDVFYYSPEYGDVAKAREGTGITFTNAQFIGWNTAANGTGVHYNALENISITNADVTLYAMWARLTSEVISSEASLNNTIARNQAVTYRLKFTASEASSVIGNFRIVSNVPDHIASISNINNSGVYSSANKTVTWTNPAFAKNNETIFSYQMTAETSISLNDIDALPLSSTATIDGSATITNNSNLTVTDAFHITYNGNGATAGIAPVDSRYYWAGTSESRAVTVASNTGNLEKTVGLVPYQMVGWNTRADGGGMHFNEGARFDIINILNDDATFYAVWASSQLTVQGSNNKAKVRRGETLTYSITINTPEAATVSNPLTLAFPIPENTTYVSASVGGQYIDNAVMFNSSNLTAGEHTYTVAVKVSEDISINDLKSINAESNLVYMGTNVVQATRNIDITKSFKVLYDITGATSGTAPVDNTFYSPEFGDTPKAKNKDTFEVAETFAGWNTSADGTGTHYWYDDTISLNTSMTSDLKLYLMELKGDYTFAGELGKELIRRGETVTFTGDVTIPEVITSGDYKINYSIPNGFTYVDVTGKTDGEVSVSGRTITHTIAHANIKGKHQVVFRLMADTDLSFNYLTDLKSTMSFTYSNKFVSETKDIKIAQSYRIIFDGNGAESGVPPVDNNYYAPLYDDLCIVPGNTGDLRKTGYSFTSWNYFQDGSGNTYYPGDKFTPLVDQTWYAQWAKVSISTNNEHGKDKVRRGETIEYVTTLDMPTVSQFTDYTLTLPDGLDFTGDGISPASGVIEGKTIKWEDVYVSSGEFNFKFKVKVSEDPSINDVKSFRISPTITASRTDIYTFHDIDVTRSYKPTFDINGGLGEIYYNRGPKFLSPEYYDRLTLPSNKDNKGAVCVYRGGYTFNGWNTAADGSGTHYASEDCFAMTEDTTYYVEWKANTYTVNFDKNDTDATGQMSPISVTYDKSASLPKNAFAKTGYAFVGWNTEKDGTGDAFIDGDEILNLTEIAADEVTLYAQWTDDFRTVTFNTNGGSSLADINVPTGGTLKKPADPTKLGYNLAGWFTDEGLSNEFNFSTPVNDNMVLYAKWTPVTYTVTFKGNGATSGSDFTETLTYDTPYSLSDLAFAKTNYTFREWNTTADGSGTSYKGSSDKPFASELLNLASTQDANVDLYAIWDAGTYTIHFDKNAADVTGEMGDITATIDEPVKLGLNKFERSGYKFAGWTITNSLKQVAFADNSSVKNLANAGQTATLYAVWTNNYRTVTFDSNGGSAVAPQYVEVGCHAVKPDDPELFGYAFDKWMYVVDEYDFLTPVNEDITLKASWNLNNYTIHFDLNGGDAGNMGDVFASYNTELKLPANTYSKIGYTFAGWNTDASGTGKTYKDGETVKNLTTDGDDVVTLYAQWNANAYSVRFDANGGEGTMPNQSFVYDSPQKLSQNTFTREGYVFLGWNDVSQASSIMYSDGETVKNMTMLNGETITLYAMWSNNAHLVKFDSNGGTKVTDQYVHDSRTATQPTDPKRKGYTFIGWYLDDALFNFNTAITEDITLTAKWVANAYTVKFDGNGADAGNMNAQNMTYNVASNLNKNSYSRTGYAFAGWNTEADASGTTYTDGQSVRNLTDEANGVLTLYATWIAGNYRISFDANGGYGTMADLDMTFDVESALPANEFIYSGNGFVGWNTEKTGTGTKYIDGATVKNLTSETGATVTLYAQWADLGDFKTITFDSNGGSNVLSQNVKTGEKTVEPKAPTKAGYTFEGWFDENDSKFEFGQELTEDITLIAKWTANTYTIKFDANGGRGNMPDQTFKFDEAQNLNKNAFTRTGYTFNEWEAEIDGEVVTYSDESEILNLTDKANATITFKAAWTANSYTVKFDSNGGDGEMADQTLVYDVETSLMSNKFTKSGFVFGGWNTDASGSGDKYIDGAKVKNLAGEAADVTLYATWIAESDAVLVDFDTGDGTPVLPQYVERGSKLTRPADPTKLGYTFVGWFNGETEYDFDTPVTDSITLSAKWIANTYTVEFAGSGEDDGVMEPMSFTYDVPRKLEKNAYTKENYHFAGWRLVGGTATILNEDSGLATFANEPEGDINGDDAIDDEQLIPDEAEVMNLTPEQNGQVSMQAVWEADSYSITYMNVEGATNNNPSSYTFGEGVPELEDAYKPGYTFDGWYDNVALSGDAVTSISAESTGDVILYAKWTEIANSDIPENPLIPSWIKKLLAGTGDVVPYVVGGIVIVLLVAGGIVLVASRKKKSGDK